MDRRSFLIGSGAILTTAFVNKSDWFLRNKNTVVPFPEVKKATKKLFFVSVGGNTFDLRLDVPDFDLPELTYRQWLSRYENPENREQPNSNQITNENLELAMGWHGIEADQLDDIAPTDLYERQWELNDSSFAKAHQYLRGLDLSNESAEGGEFLGDLHFIWEHEMEFGYTVGVRSENPLTASLLQARLIELGRNVAVELAYE